MAELDPNVFPTVTYRRPTPMGTIFVHIMEQDDKPVRIIINSGKAGSEFAAYCDSLARLATVILDAFPERGMSILMSELSNITTDRAIINPTGVRCRSGAEGVYLVLLDYIRDKQNEDERLNGQKYRPAYIRINA